MFNSLGSVFFLFVCVIRLKYTDVQQFGVSKKQNQFTYLKCPYNGFLKITFHAVCNSEWKHSANFKSESTPCIKLSLKRKSRVWIIEMSRF